MTAKKAKPKKIRLKADERATRAPEKRDPISLLPAAVDLRIDRDTARMIADVLEGQAEELYSLLQGSSLDALPGAVRSDIHLRMEVFYEVANDINKRCHEWGDE